MVSNRKTTFSSGLNCRKYQTNATRNHAQSAPSAKTFHRSGCALIVPGVYQLDVAVLIRGPRQTPLLHSVLHDDIHVGWACGASGRRGLHADRNSRAGGIVLRNRAGIVGRRRKR